MVATPVSAAASVEDAADAIARVIGGRRVAVLTGAGLSTDSGIPDYRGDGSKPRTNPMTAQRFVGDEAARKRYWAGSALGWRRMRDTSPNAGHLALASLERAGVVAGIATQNVDSLHAAAGTVRLIELHGHLRTVSCLACGTPETRESLDARLRALNPWLPRDLDEVPLNPDGDAEVVGVDGMVVPACLVCGGMLKPDVVFFGEFVRPENRMAAEALVDDADVLLSAGSSLAVNTGRRLIHRARRGGKPVAIIKRGPTAADREADLRIEGGTSEVLSVLAARLGAGA
ncbi:MAG: Sir2 family NAD-dependent protein deacetylase [Pseudoclavibacter sp.]